MLTTRLAFVTPATQKEKLLKHYHYLFPWRDGSWVEFEYDQETCYTYAASIASANSWAPSFLRALGLRSGEDIHGSTTDRLVVRDEKLLDARPGQREANQSSPPPLFILLGSFALLKASPRPGGAASRHHTSVSSPRDTRPPLQMITRIFATEFVQENRCACS